MFSKFHSLIRNNRGQTLVELALILPILLLLIFGIIEFGRIFNAHLTLTHASREGARAGAVHTINEEIENIVIDASYPLIIDDTNINIEVDPPENPPDTIRDTGDAITVEINSTIEIFTPVISNLLENPYPVSGKTTMRVE